MIHVGGASEEKRQQLNDILQDFITKGLVFEIVFRSGKPVDVILNVAEEKNVDLLVLGALQRENFLKYYVGSIARKITRNTKCAVLLLVKPSVERIPCQHIVVSGIENSDKTVYAALYISDKLCAEQVTIVEEISQQEVAVTIEDDKSLRKANLAKERIRLRENSRIAQLLQTFPKELTQGVVIKSQPIFGKRGYSIGHYAEVVRADLLIINSPNKMSFWDRLFPHDIEHILTELPTDVLILK